MVGNRAPAHPFLDVEQVDEQAGKTVSISFRMHALLVVALVAQDHSFVSAFRTLILFVPQV
jgi:hypothetical protein